MVAGGTDNGDPVIVSINEDFRDPASREGLVTRISARFMGGHMLQSPENRQRFEDAVESFLAGDGGVFVALLLPVSGNRHRIACRLTRSSKAFVRSACMTIRSGPSIRVGFQTKTSLAQAIPDAFKLGRIGYSR
jgi:hypothetical protein